jgi:hypothetical protein
VAIPTHRFMAIPNSFGAFEARWSYFSIKVFFLQTKTNDTDDRRSGAPAIWGKVKNIQVKRDVLIE